MIKIMQWKAKQKNIYEEQFFEQIDPQEYT